MKSFVYALCTNDGRFTILKKLREDEILDDSVNDEDDEKEVFMVEYVNKDGLQTTSSYLERVEV